MTYQGELARPMDTEAARYFAVSKVRIDSNGHVTDVLWSEMNAGSDRDIGAGVTATAAEVVDAIHDGAKVMAVFPPEDRLPERPFVIVMHENGRECIAFDGVPSPGRNIADLDSLDD
jgi:hypothetical protein